MFNNLFNNQAKSSVNPSVVRRHPCWSQRILLIWDKSLMMEVVERRRAPMPVIKPRKWTHTLHSFHLCLENKMLPQDLEFSGSGARMQSLLETSHGRQRQVALALLGISWQHPACMGTCLFSWDASFLFSICFPRSSVFQSIQRVSLHFQYISFGTTYNPKRLTKEKLNFHVSPHTQSTRAKPGETGSALHFNNHFHLRWTTAHFLGERNVTAHPSLSWSELNPDVFTWLHFRGKLLIFLPYKWYMNACFT